MSSFLRLHKVKSVTLLCKEGYCGGKHQREKKSPGTA